MSWRQSVERYEREAVAILKRYRLPTEAEILKKRNIQPEDNLSRAAILVIYGAHHLRKGLAQGRCEDALDRLSQVRDAYLEMWLREKVPEYEKGTILGDDTHAIHSLVRDIRGPKLKQKRAIDNRHKANRQAKEKAILLCNERRKDRPVDTVGEVIYFVKVAMEKDGLKKYSEKTIRTWVASQFPPKARKGGRPRNST